MMKILIEEVHGEYILSCTVRGVHSRYVIKKNYEVEYDSYSAPFTRSEVRNLIKLYEGVN